MAWKVGLLSALVSLWWAVGLQVEAAYGVNVLKYTETVPATSGASLASEIIRGLGYWYFYGSDRVGPWTQTAVAYTQNIWLIVASFVVPALCFVAAVFSRWRHRAYFVLLTVVGMVLAVGPNPYADPTGVGSLIKAFMVDTTAGLALRSTDRASPLVILGLAMFLGGGVSAVAARVRRTGLVVGVFAVAAVAGATVPLWTGGDHRQRLHPAGRAPRLRAPGGGRPRHGSHPGTRVYALPGNDFAAYRWGDTIDTVYPGLMTRPFVTHEQQIMGSLATADVLQAVDTPLQDGTMDWNALAPMASLMSAGDVLVQYDQAYERYDTPIPQQLASDLAVTPPGLTDPVSYGTPRPNVPLIPHFDEATLARPPNQGWTAPLVSYTVDRSPPDRPDRVDHAPRWWSTATPSGIVNAASVGLLAGNPTILYAGTLDTDTRRCEGRPWAGRPTWWSPTPTASRGTEWNSLNENTGYTETAAQGPDTTDPSRRPARSLPQGPGRRPDHRRAATACPRSPPRPTAPRSPTCPRTGRPAALDGNTQTAWLDDSFVPPVGQWWQVVLAQPRTDELPDPASSPRPATPTGPSPGSPSPSTAATRSPSPWARPRCSPPGS